MTQTTTLSSYVSRRSAELRERLPQAIQVGQVVGSQVSKLAGIEETTCYLLDKLYKRLRPPPSCSPASGLLQLQPTRKAVHIVIGTVIIFIELLESGFCACPLQFIPYVRNCHVVTSRFPGPLGIPHRGADANRRNPPVLPCQQEEALSTRLPTSFPYPRI